MGLVGINSLDDYLARFGADLLGKVREMFPPEEPSEVSGLVRRLYKTQIRQAASPLVSRLRKYREAVLVAECGYGKTAVAIAVARTLSRLRVEPGATEPTLGPERPYRVVVMCPGHLVKKWAREVEECWPSARSVIIKRAWEINDMERIPWCPEFIIIGRDRAKLSWYWEPAVEMSATGKPRCPKCGAFLALASVPDKDSELSETDQVKRYLSRRRRCCTFEIEREFAGRVVKMGTCNEQLWQADPSRTRRVAPVDWIVKKGFQIDLFVPDEVHEAKARTAQGNTMGKFAKHAKKVLALTGTLAGGKAIDLFYLMFRLAPQRVIDDGFAWGSDMRWSRRYGVVEDLYAREDPDASDAEEHNKSSSGGKYRGSRVLPGIAPGLFGRHLLDRTVFCDLSGVKKNLPKYSESFQLVDMDPDLVDSYQEIEERLRAFITENLREGRKKLGTLINTLLAYPDRPYEWEPITDEEGMIIVEPRTLGFQNANKAKAVVRWVLDEIAEGRRVWIYIRYSVSRNCTPILKYYLQQEGLNVAVLDASVNPDKREQWVHRCKADVVISNAELVKTGLDLLNYPSIAFYQTGYSVFTLRQASRRSWRIGQTLPVKVRFFGYRNTVQEDALRLMSRKTRAALAIEGQLSSEGLLAMTRGEDPMLELAKMLVDRGREKREEKSGVPVRTRSRLETLRAEGVKLQRFKGRLKDPGFVSNLYRAHRARTLKETARSFNRDVSLWFILEE